MNERSKRIFWKVVAVHFGLILGILIWPLVTGKLFRPKKKEIIFVDLLAGMPEVAVEPVSEIKAPEPPAPEPPKQPEPPKDIPEPKKKPKVEKSTKKIKKQDLPKPQPKAPRLSPEEIRKLLASGMKVGQGGTATEQVPFAWYYVLIRQIMYDAWNQPSGLSASAGLVTEVTVRVMKDGRINRRTMTQSSGNTLMDDSVMAAVNSVGMLRPLPAEFAAEYKDIAIQFELTRETLF